MTTVGDLLRDADPVRHDPPPAAVNRERTRWTIVDHAARPNPPARQAKPLAFTVGIVLLAAALAAGYQSWPRSGGTLQAAVRFEVRLAESEPAAGLRRAPIAGSDRVIYLHDEILVSNGDVAESRVEPARDLERFAVHIRLNPAAADRMRHATSGHAGRPVAILIDGQVLAAPVVRGPISTSAIISGDYTEAEARRIARGVLIQ